MSIITTFVGHVGGKDAVVRQVGDTTVTGFSMAADNGYGDKKQTLWFDCSGFGKRYEAVAPYLVKGTQVFVTGEQGEREHEGKVYKTLRLNDLQLVGSKPKEGGASSGGIRAPRPQREAQPVAGGFDEPEFEDDLPF